MAGFATATSALTLITTPIYATSAATTSQTPYKAPMFVVPMSRAQAIPASGVPWVDEQIRRVAALRRDWDGYGADPIETVRLVELAELVREHFHQGLPAGNLVPGADGSIQLEWHMPVASFGMSVEPDGALYAWHRSRKGDPFKDADGGPAVRLLEASVLQALV